MQSYHSGKAAKRLILEAQHSAPTGLTAPDLLRGKSFPSFIEPTHEKPLRNIEVTSSSGSPVARFFHTVSDYGGRVFFGCATAGVCATFGFVGGVTGGLAVGLPVAIAGYAQLGQTLGYGVAAAVTIASGIGGLISGLRTSFSEE